MIDPNCQGTAHHAHHWSFLPPAIFDLGFLGLGDDHDARQQHHRQHRRPWSTKKPSQSHGWMAWAVVSMDSPLRGATALLSMSLLWLWSEKCTCSHVPGMKQIDRLFWIYFFMLQNWVLLIPGFSHAILRQQEIPIIDAHLRIWAHQWELDLGSNTFLLYKWPGENSGSCACKVWGGTKHLTTLLPLGFCKAFIGSKSIHSGCVVKHESNLDVFTPSSSINRCKGSSRSKSTQTLCSAPEFWPSKASKNGIHLHKLWYKYWITSISTNTYVLTQSYIHCHIDVQHVCGKERSPAVQFNQFPSSSSCLDSPSVPYKIRRSWRISKNHSSPKSQLSSWRHNLNLVGSVKKWVHLRPISSTLGLIPCEKVLGSLQSLPQLS